MCSSSQFWYLRSVRSQYDILVVVFIVITEIEVQALEKHLSHSSTTTRKIPRALPRFSLSTRAMNRGLIRFDPGGVNFLSPVPFCLISHTPHLALAGFPSGGSQGHKFENDYVCEFELHN